MRLQKAAPHATGFYHTRQQRARNGSAEVGTTYFYWVKACNGYGCSDDSASDTGYRRREVHLAYLPLVLRGQP